MSASDLAQDSLDLGVVDGGQGAPRFARLLLRLAPSQQEELEHLDSSGGVWYLVCVGLPVGGDKVGHARRDRSASS